MGRLWPFVVGSVALGLDAYVVAGLLPAIASSMNARESTVGLGVAAFTGAYAVAGPLLAGRAGRRSRRSLILSLLVFTVANLVTALSSTVVVFLVTRIVAGAAAGGVLALIVRGCRRTRGRRTPGTRVSPGPCGFGSWYRVRCPDRLGAGTSLGVASRHFVDRGYRRRIPSGSRCARRRTASNTCVGCGRPAAIDRAPQELAHGDSDIADWRSFSGALYIYDRDSVRGKSRHTPDSCDLGLGRWRRGGCARYRQTHGSAQPAASKCDHSRGAHLRVARHDAGADRLASSCEPICLGNVRVGLTCAPAAHPSPGKPG